jgi:histidyl-tRNA synthetase
MVERIMEGTSIAYGFGGVTTPMFEELELFTKKSGDGVVEELYAFKDKGGRDLALRPELTAAVIRLYANNMQDVPKPVKLFYFGECFRYERPQAGRYREFRQFGAEIIGGDEVATNIEIIALALDILKGLGLKDFSVRIGYLNILRKILDDAGIEASEQGPFMRLIDKQDLAGLKDLLAKRGLSEEVVNDIFLVANFKGGNIDDLSALDVVIKRHEVKDAISIFKDIMSGVLSSGVIENDRLSMDLGIARGLDYYTGMVFEVDVPDLGAEKQVCGGGAYALTEMFGLEATNTTGFAMGVDRLILALEKQGVLKSVTGPKVFVIPFKGTEENAVGIVRALRKAGVSVDHDLSGRNLSKNLKYASSIKAGFAILVGQKELEKGVVTVRDLDTGEQTEVKLDDIVEYFNN